jgi:hypothetical protein
MTTRKAKAEEGKAKEERLRQGGGVLVRPESFTIEG